MRHSLKREERGSCPYSVPIRKERLLLWDVFSADIVSHMTDGSSADYGILTFGIASNIFDKLASFYI